MYVDSHSLGQLALASKRTASGIKELPVGTRFLAMSVRDLVNIKKIQKSKTNLDTIDPTHPPLYPKKNLENLKSN